MIGLAPLVFSLLALFFILLLRDIHHPGLGCGMEIDDVA